jgi:hypothetical protein
VLELARITYLYCLIECTPKAKFVKVFELARITYVYWPIECTPKA